ncbi:MAG: hypothetical protein AAGG55_16155 [Pseudomonadota bacterium]
MTEAPRILIYGTGRHGTEAASIALDRGWELVSAYNRSGPKIGKDLGHLLSAPRSLGVTVESCEGVDFNAIDADIAIVAMTDRLQSNMPAYEALLGAGINVLCHGSESYFPHESDPVLAEKIDTLAKDHGVTFTGTGVWDHSRIWAGLLAAGPCQRLDSLLHKSRTRIDVSPYIELVGTGLTVPEFHEQIVEHPGPLGGLYKTIPSLVMHGLGFDLESVTETREPVLFDHPVFCPGLSKDIEPGICAGTRIVAEARSTCGVVARAEIELRLFEEGEVDNMEWQINGDPDSGVLMARYDSLRTSSMCLINRVQDVIASPPGNQLITSMGPLRFVAT